MTIKTVKNGVVYQMEHDFEGIGPVDIDICYSGGEPNHLEFEYAVVDLDSQFPNRQLTEDQIDHLNKELECGLEFDIVLHLIHFYSRSDYRFDPNEYTDQLETYQRLAR